VANANGRLDRDGICPYHCDENDDPKFPTEGMIEAWWTSKAKPGKGESKTLSWASRELESMPMIIRTALKIEKMMEFMVEAGFHPRDLNFLTPEQEDRTQHDRRLRMWGVIQNFLRRVMKGAFPEMESCSYFRDEEECEVSYGKGTLSLPALGVILVQRERDRQMETSLTVSNCGVVLTTDLRERMGLCHDKRRRRLKRARGANAAKDGRRAEEDHHA
jgi:hypothetical protein